MSVLKIEYECECLCYVCMYVMGVVHDVVQCTSGGKNIHVL